MPRAMVVDDSVATRFILEKMLKELGYEVSQAVNGKDALAVLEREGNFTLALVDWNMPVMNGYELVCEVRKLSQHDPMKIVMVTTETEIERVVKALEAGANEYVMKPFSKDIIHDKMKLLGLED